MTHTPADPRPVTHEELRKIRTLALQGKGDPEIAAALGRARSTVTKRRGDMGVPPGNPPIKAATKPSVIRAVEALQTAEVAVILGSDPPLCACGCGETPPPGRTVYSNACAARIGNRRRAQPPADANTVLGCGIAVTDCLLEFLRYAARDPSLRALPLFAESQKAVDNFRDCAIADMED